MLVEAVLEWAARVLETPSPEDVFAYICAVLNAPSYVLLFEERGLIGERPRVPLTLDRDFAEDGVRLGARVIELWTLRAPPHPAIRWSAGTTASHVGDYAWDNEAEALEVAGRRLEGITDDVATFQVSGYPVLFRYLRDRAEQPADANSLEEVRRVASAVRALVELGPELDLLLEGILAGELARLDGFVGSSQA